MSGQINTLQTALEQVLHRGGGAPFDQRIVGFIRQLVAGQAVVLLMPGQDGLAPVFSSPEGATPPMGLAQQVFAEPAGAPSVAADGTMFAARLLTEDGTPGIVTVDMGSAQKMALALAHERLTLVAQLTYERFAEDALTGLSHLLNGLNAATTAEPDAMQQVADRLAAFTQAGFAAVGWYNGNAVTPLVVSGQSELGRRSPLAADLRTEMAETGQMRLASADRAFGGAEGGTEGLVFHLFEPRANAGFLPLIAATAGRVAGPVKRRRTNWRRMGRRALVVTGLAALSFIPVPRGVDLPATVASTSARIVSSPLNAPLKEIRVSEGVAVVAGETVLALLDTRDLDLDLIALQADRSAALLDREAARASRKAADLTRAELEYERLEARIASIEAQRADATLIAPISGLVVGEGLRDKLGVFLRQGDAILRIADPAGLELDLFIPQDDIAQTRIGNAGIFRPDFDPTLRFDAEISAVSPAAPRAERHPKFPGTASISGDLQRLRPGMTGVVSINREPVPIWQIVWTRLRDWALLRLWI